ncbi:MAG TPA: hypothetical protein VMW53_07320 [archaeon]|nr:hypothetical protein [archaeon]
MLIIAIVLISAAMNMAKKEQWEVDVERYVVQTIAAMPIPTPTKSIDEAIAKMSEDAKKFQDTLLHYAQSLEECEVIEVGEYIQGDVALLFWQELQKKPALFENTDFVKVCDWLLDDIDTFCTRTAVDDPVLALATLNQTFGFADEEYRQFAVQARLGLSTRDLDLIASAFNHRQKAREYIQEASFYYEELFKLYID